MDKKIYICKCKVCQKNFEAFSPNKLYCSEYCKYYSFKKNCILCNKEFYGSKKQKYCSKECYEKDFENIRKRVEETNLKLYGVKNVFQSKEIQKKIKETNLKKYGVENPKKNKEVVEKTKRNNIKKYGVSSPSKTQEIKNKIAATNIKKYGEKTVLMIPKYREKSKQTCIKKYGVDSFTKTNEFKEKCKKTHLEKTGKEWFTQTDEYKEKTIKTNKEKRGVEWGLQSKEIREKIEKTNLEKYGYKNPFQSKEIREKVKKTCKERYGVENIMSLEIMKEKAKKTCLAKYGTEWETQKHLKNKENLNIEFIRKNFIKDDKFDLYEFQKYFGYSNITAAHNAKTALKIIEPNITNLGSINQNKLYDYLKKIYKKEITFNNKTTIKPLELDIYITEKKIAIEFDGIFYHSFGKTKNLKFNNYEKENIDYHLNKTQLCEEKGIKLFHIFENEWLDEKKQEIWKSVIKNSLGYSDRKIFGRKCSIRQINQDELFPFLIENHLQGPALSSINYGLYYNDELVSVMTFGKSRFNKNYDWELIRFCNKINTNVIGSFSKLLKHFKKHNTGTIISYGNRRWVSSLNNVYSKNGGKLIKVSKPNYYYFKDNDKSLKLESRIKYQKHKLKNILENFDESLSETENMYNNGYRKIYDCGNLVYKL